MADIDSFATQLWEEAKAFLEKSRVTELVASKEAYLHAALNLGFCALEAHLNAIAEDFLTRTDLSPHERSILSEKKVELENGKFRVTKQVQIYRLEDRLLFLCHRFSKQAPFDRNAKYWGDFKMASDLRNGLTHPKTPAHVTVAAVERSLQAILQLLNVTYRRIYRKNYPGLKRGLEPTVEV